MIEFLGAFKRFLTDQGVPDGTAHKAAAVFLGKMDKGMPLSPPEIILGTTYIQIGDIKGNATSTDFADETFTLGYTEIRVSYDRDNKSTSKTPNLDRFRPASTSSVGALRRRPTKIDPTEKGYTEVEWTYLGNGTKVPNKASLAKLAADIVA